MSGETLMPILLVGTVVGFGVAFWLERGSSDPSVLEALKCGSLYAGLAATILYFAAGLLVGFPDRPSGDTQDDGGAYEDAHADRGRSR